MAKTLNRLSARQAASLTEPGRHADGGNLYLSISPKGSKRWVFMYKRDGRQKEAGLGSAQSVSLKAARESAQPFRELLAQGLDPIAVRAAGVKPAMPTFGEFADQFVDSIESGFRNEKHRYQWRQTLGIAYCKTIRAKKIDDISVEDILRILQPLWAAKQETASRLRGRIERVFDAARAKGLRAGENPAAWKGNLKELLPARKKLQRGHQPAMPYTDVPAFVARLRERDATSALALEFLILTASRAGEVFGALWGEIDLQAQLWTVPASRMKGHRQHRVPLGGRAVEILEHVALIRQTEEPDAFVFPGATRGKPMSNMAFASLIKRMKATGFVPHGFRSSSRDWCYERTTYPSEIAEAALAHIVGNSVERAYRRGDALDKRRELMEDWARFIEPKPANVVAFKPIETST